MTATAIDNSSPSPAAIKLAAPAARILLGSIFFTSGVAKVAAYDATAAYMDAAGVPGALLPLVILLEIAGPAALALGAGARLAAIALAGFSLLTAIIFHADFADQLQQIMFWKNVAIAGGLLHVAAQGPGPYSLAPRF